MPLPGILGGFKIVRSNFFIFLEPEKKSGKIGFFGGKIDFFRKIGDFSPIFLLLIFPSQNRFQPNRFCPCRYITVQDSDNIAEYDPNGAQVMTQTGPVER